MAIERNIFYIKGKMISHSMYFGSSLKDKEIEVIGSITDFQFEHYAEYNVPNKGISISPFINMDNDKLSLFNEYMLISEYRPATKFEIKYFDSVLASYNLVFEYRDWVNVCYPYNRDKFEKHADVLNVYYKDKDNMQIVIGGETITYKQLKKIEFNNDDKIVLRGDNGYSHCWADTINADKVFGFIENLFKIPSVNNDYKTNNISLQALAKKGEFWGYQFTDKGQLKLNLTKKDIHFSEVSNS